VIYARTVEPAEAPVTLTEFKAWLRIDEDDRAEDTYLTALIDGAVKILDGREGLLGRALVTQTWQLKCWGPVQNKIRLRLGGVASITSISTIVNGSSTAWAGYRLQSDAIGHYVEPQDSASWPAYDVREDAFTITFVAGYGAASAVPETVKSAVKMLAAQRYRMPESAAMPEGFLNYVAPFRVRQL
jgi:uncharacterized phiE125 gp8 family phage protein